MITDLLAAEWIKLRSVRSTWWALAVAVLAVVGVAAIVCHFEASSWNLLAPRQRAGFDPLNVTFGGFSLGQLAVGTVGVLAFSAEHGTGTIRATLAAAPYRRRVLAAKAAVVAALVLVAGQVIAFAAFLVGQAFLDTAGIGVTLGHRHVLPAVLAAGLYLAVVGLIGLGLGTLIRHTAGALAALFGLLFLVAPIAVALPAPWNHRIASYLPSIAAQQVSSLHPSHLFLSPSWSLVVLLGYVVVLLGGAAWLITRRDA